MGTDKISKTKRRLAEYSEELKKIQKNSSMIDTLILDGSPFFSLRMISDFVEVKEYRLDYIARKCNISPQLYRGGKVFDKIQANILIEYLKVELEKKRITNNG